MDIILRIISTDSFWICVAFVIVVIFALVKVRTVILGSAYARIERIIKEISEAQSLREEAQNLLVEYQKKHKEALKLVATIAQDAKTEAIVAAKNIQEAADDAIARAKHRSHDSIVKAEVEVVEEIRTKIFDTAIQIVTLVAKEELKHEKAANVLIDDAIEEIGTLKAFKPTIG